MQKQHLLLIAGLLLCHTIFAQKSYWEVTSDMFDNTKRNEGVTLTMEQNNKVVAYTNNSVSFGNGEDFKRILNSFFSNYDVLRDSLSEAVHYTFHFFYNPGQKNGLTIIAGKEREKRYVVVDEKPMMMKPGKDTVNIDPYNPATKTTSVFSFVVNRVEDLRPYAQSNIINDFIEKANNDIKAAKMNVKPAIKGENFHTFNFQSRFIGNYYVKDGSVAGNLKPYYAHPQMNISVSAAASLQNFKSYMVPSFNTSLDVYMNGYTKSEYLRLGVYWEPVFLFDKEASGKLQAYRNDFVGLVYEYRRGNDNTRLGFFAPISIAYLVSRRGSFFEKNTFNFGIGGIKYGAMTLRPSMFFNGFLKNVSPSVQLSVSWGR